MKILMKMVQKLLFTSDVWLGIVCHPSTWCDWCLSEDDKKGIEPIFTDKVEKR